MQVERPHIQIFIPLNHGMIFLPSEVRGPMRMAVIHSFESVHVVRPEQMNHFLDRIT
jgi:hypothetical protein